ncbi:unnamed protein product [Zymoseptoria tritici ST99CH_1A5]|uniref:Aquaporin n=1 Tax=Zymoseptoria tritici ST99CH_1A5 TaxID=1276529 RepID=A0A1Y6LKS7_ZYMTR|nr:unnamed protein product [Zymoseptoria tritici ST99CH_1A5]
MSQPHLPTSTYVPDRAPPPLPEGENTSFDDGPGLEKSSTFETATPVSMNRSRSNTYNRERKQSNAASMMEGSHFGPQVDFDLGDDVASNAPPPQRNPSRQQMMRYPGPSTPSEFGGFGHDDPDAKHWPRPPYDYGVPMRAPSTARSYWGEEPPYYNRPYNRRMTSVRESDEWHGGGGRGPPRPPRSNRYHSYDDDDSDDQRLRRPRKKPSMRSDRSTPPPEVVMRLPFTTWMNGSIKGHFVAAIGEFMGTTMFLFFAFAGTQVANIGAESNDAQTTTNADTGFSPIVLLYIALSFGFSLMTNVWIFFRISGGMFNPAVTLAMVMVKAVTIVRGLLLVASQLLGAIFASYVVSVLFPTTFNVRTTLSKGTSVTRGVFIEAMLTAELIFAIYMLANEKHKATFMAPIGIGMALFIAEMVGVYYTGGSLNPARSFGPCVVSGVWDAEHWIYWLGPACGAVLAWGFYRVIKMLEYEMANPGQEASSKHEAAAEQEAVEADLADMTPKKEEV